MKSDYLKYWKVIRYYIKAKYGLTQPDLDVLFFLYTEKYFSRKDFSKYDNIMSWDRNRFHDLINRGWIEIFRRKVGRERQIYTISNKAIRMVEEVYNKLNGDEIVTGDPSNPLYKRNVSYSDKVHRNMIEEMNNARRQQQRLSPE